MPDAEHPDAALERSESLTLSFLLLLERLSPEERAAFLLHEVFDYSHAEAAAILGIAEDACRQRVHRAKQRLREGRPRFHRGRGGAAAPAATLRRGDGRARAWTSLQALFAEDAVHISDGGGVARATLRPLHGADRLARLYLQIGAQPAPGYGVRYESATLNGAPALFMYEGDTLVHRDVDRMRRRAHHRDPRAAPPGKLARLLAVTKPAALRVLALKRRPSRPPRHEGAFPMSRFSVAKHYPAMQPLLAIGQQVEAAGRRLRVWLRTTPSKTTVAPSSACLMAFRREAVSITPLTMAACVLRLPVVSAEPSVDPPLTGGRSATSSPGLSLASGAAYSWFTDIAMEAINSRGMACS